MQADQLQFPANSTTAPFRFWSYFIKSKDMMDWNVDTRTRVRVLVAVLVRLITRHEAASQFKSSRQSVYRLIDRAHSRFEAMS